jgi:hypothetical protein
MVGIAMQTGYLKNMNLTPQDQALLDQAECLTDFLNSKAYQAHLKPFLLQLAQEGYPDPKDYADKPQPQQALLLDYTRKVGETSSVKKMVEFIEQQPSVLMTIRKKLEEADHAI